MMFFQLVTLERCLTEVEGYYRIKGSTEFCIERAIAFAPYADAGRKPLVFTPNLGRLVGGWRMGRFHYRGI